MVIRTGSRKRPIEFGVSPRPDTINIFLFQLENISSGGYQLKKIKDICSTTPPLTEALPEVVPICNSFAYVEYPTAFSAGARLMEFNFETLNSLELKPKNSTISYRTSPIVFSNSQLGIRCQGANLSFAICNLASVRLYREENQLLESKIFEACEAKLPMPLVNIVSRYALRENRVSFFPMVHSIKTITFEVKNESNKTLTLSTTR